MELNIMFEVAFTILQALFPTFANPSPDECGAPTAKATEAARISSVAVGPATDTSKAGNAILHITFESKPEFRSLAIFKGKERLTAKDDGVYPDREAGDGEFSALAKLPETPTRLVRSSFRDNEGVVAMFKFKFKFKVIPCPPNCKTPLGGSCWFCIEVTEVEVGN